MIHLRLLRVTFERSLMKNVQRYGVDTKVLHGLKNECHSYYPNQLRGGEYKFFAVICFLHLLANSKQRIPKKELCYFFLLTCLKYEIV